MKRFVVPLVLIAALGGLFTYALVLQMTDVYERDNIPSPLVGKPVPAFSLPRLDDPGKQVSAESLRGKVYLLNVWASWCPSCRQEHVIFNEIARQKIVPIVGLNYKDERADALKWLDELGNPYDVNLVLDAKPAIDLFGIYGAPETFVVDKQGVIRYKHIGPVVVSPKLDAGGKVVRDSRGEVVYLKNDWADKFLPLLRELDAS